MVIIITDNYDCQFLSSLLSYKRNPIIRNRHTRHGVAQELNNSCKMIDPSNAELNPICHLLVLLGARHVFHISGLKVKAPVYIQKIFLNIYYINYGIIESSVEHQTYSSSCSHNTILIAETSKSAVVTLNLAPGIIL